MINPMLCRLEASASNSDKILWERKYDGARIIARVAGSDHILQSRSGKDKTDHFPELRLETALPAVIDGEIIPVDESLGFNGIQRRVNRTLDVGWAVKEYPARLVVWDILELDGHNVRNLPLVQRRNLLEKALTVTGNVGLSPVYTDGEALFLLAKQKGWEGVIGKPKDSLYVEGSRLSWTKVKTWQSGLFFACGWTAGTGARASTFGALMLMDGNRKFVGKVGTGFDDSTIRGLMAMFKPASCPWPKAPEPATWILPFPVKIQYLEYTNDGILRFPSFKGVV